MASCILHDNDDPDPECPRTLAPPVEGAVRAGGLTAYEAAYVVLAEMVQAPVVTADRRLANIPGITVPVEVV